MGEGKRITLDPRLSMLAEMVGRCACYADVGCDHGRLGAFLLQRNWVEKAVLTDISALSLDKAKNLIRLLGFEDRVVFHVCDGVEGIDEDVDAVVIAGMGGTTVADIIERGRDHLGDARLILQANVALPELRRRLNAAGYRITEENIVKDGRRQYILMEAVRGEQHCDFREEIVGPVLLQKRPPALRDYAAFRLRVAQKALKGAELGGDEQGAQSLKEEIRIWEDVLA